MANEEKIRAVVAKIIADPRSWEQDSIVHETLCGTSFCFAGHTAVLEGWVVVPRLFGSLAVVANETADTYMNADVVMGFAMNVLGLDPYQRDALFLWMPQDYPDADFTPAGLVAKVLEVTGIDCSDLLPPAPAVDREERRRLAISGLDWIREHRSQWDQSQFISTWRGYITVCWGGAVLLANGYQVDGGCFVIGDVSQSAMDLLDKMFGIDDTHSAPLLDDVIGYVPMDHGDEEFDELTRRVQDWLQSYDNDNTANTNEQEKNHA